MTINKTLVISPLFFMVCSSWDSSSNWCHCQYFLWYTLLLTSIHFSLNCFFWHLHLPSFFLSSIYSFSLHHILPLLLEHNTRTHKLSVSVSLCLSLCLSLLLKFLISLTISRTSTFARTLKSHLQELKLVPASSLSFCLLPPTGSSKQQHVF